MKISPAWWFALGAIPGVWAQTAPPNSSQVKIDVTAPNASAPKNAKKDAPKDPKKDAKKKEEEMGKIEGQEIARGDKGFMGIRVVDGVFRLTFYNKKKKPIPPDVSRAALRWHATYKLPDERTVLNPGGDANSLTSGFTVRPPLTFKLYITLLAAGGEDGTEAAGETYTIDFRQ